MSTAKLSKRDLTEDVAAATGTTKAAAKQAVDVVFEALANRLSKGETVGVDGLGVFRVVQRAPTRRRNPKTGAPVFIPARRAIKLRICLAITRALEGGTATATTAEPLAAAASASA